MNISIDKILEYELFRGDNFNLTLGSLLLSVAILAFTKWGLWIFKKMVIRNSHDSKDDGKKLAFFQIFSYIIWTFIFVMILESHGLNLTLLVAGSTALLVGIGLGLQQSFNDLISGLLILFERTIQVGDVVEVDLVVGRVQEIGLRTSKILSRDHIVMIVPNSKFISERVTNWSHNEHKTRFNISVGVAYGSDTSQVKDLLLECAQECKGVSNTPAAFVRFTSFGDSSLDFELFFWNEDVFYVEEIQSQLRYLVDKKFRDNNITIPFPQRDLHIKSRNELP